MDIQTRTDRGRLRPVNEDAVLTFSLGENEVVLLADGLGGHRAGEVASRMVVESMRDALCQNGLDPIEPAIRAAAGYANERVYASQREVPERAGMGSTLVMAVITQDELHIAHAGDSRAYLFSEGELIQLTRDHSVSNDLRGSSGEMSENLKHMLTRAMGTEPDIQIDYRRLEASDRAILLLCSDGLSNEVSPEEMQDVLAGEETLSGKADRLLLLANENGGKDNITLALCERRGETA